MAVQVVNQNSVLDRALELAREAKARIWLTSPWITSRAVNLLLQSALPRVRVSELEIRIAYRVKEATNLEITDLDALKALEDAGCQIRYSTRLHAKLVLVDERAAIVSSSNLTSTAGYGSTCPRPGGTRSSASWCKTSPTSWPSSSSSSWGSGTKRPPSSPTQSASPWTSQRSGPSASSPLPRRSAGRVRDRPRPRGRSHHRTDHRGNGLQPVVPPDEPGDVDHSGLFAAR
jgi:hypothetical protein